MRESERILAISPMMFQSNFHKIFPFFVLYFLFFAPLVLFSQAADLSAEFPSATQALEEGEKIRARWPRERPIDENSLRADGVRRLDGKHIRLYTDLPSSETIDELPAVFDLMIPKVCAYFELEPATTDSFVVEAFLIEDEKKFQRGGAMRQVPNLRHGYALRNRIWLRNQGSDYYRRHLLLHEGVHAFMGWAFGVWGPPWYREGTAEWLSTHLWEPTSKSLTLAYFPKKKGELRGWGRIEHIQNAVERKKHKSPLEIFELRGEDYDENEAYAWSWAFAAFCEGHPDYRRPFRRLAWVLHDRQTPLPDHFLLLLKQHVEEENEAGDQTSESFVLRRPFDQKQLENDWLHFQKNVDYNYDFPRMMLPRNMWGTSISKPIPPGKTVTVEVRADRGWQASTYHFERGKRYRITATGRVQLAKEPSKETVWWSEPNGITIRYCGDFPIGRLLMTQVSGTEVKEERPGAGFLNPQNVGATCEFTAESAAPVYFRINDFAGELSDNAGSYTVTIQNLDALPTF